MPAVDLGLFVLPDSSDFFCRSQGTATIMNIQYIIQYTYSYMCRYCISKSCACSHFLSLPPNPTTQDLKPPQ